MNRLQKKCIIGTVGAHLLLLLILLVGPAFFNQEPKVDNTAVLDMIPANLVDAAVNSGVQNAHPPAPQPVVTPPQQPPPLPPMPPLPARNFQPPPPAPTPAPSFLDRFKSYFTPKPTVTPNLTPTEKPPTTKPDNIKISLNKVTRTKPKNTPDNSKQINNTLRNLEKNLSPGTSVEMPGTSSASYASYASAVKSVYEQALRSNLPDQVANNSENTKVEITVSSDGTVVSSRIISPSGDSAWDNAVQRTLDQVTFIAPFPDGAMDKERHYTLSFNPEVEKSFE